MSRESYLSGKIDETLANSLPAELFVRRVSAWRPVRTAKHHIKKALRLIKCLPSDATTLESPQSHILPSHNGSGSLPSRCKELYAGLETFVCATPDPEVAWFIPALCASLELVRSHRPQALYCTGPPHSANLIAVALSAITRLPLVLDFRDPWSRTQWETADRGLRVRVSRCLERVCVKSAAIVILNTPQLHDEFRVHYPSSWSNKFAVLPNGFEPDLVRQARELLDRYSPVHPNGTFRLCHTGTVYGNRDLRPLISLAGKMSSPNHHIQIEQIGDVEHGDQLRAWISAQHLNEHIHFAGRVPHAEVLRRMAAAHALLIIQPDTDIQVPGKLFEMLPFKKPILALTGQGATQALMSKYQLGAHAAPGDYNGLVTAFQHVRDWTMNESSDRLHEQALTDFDGKTLTGQLAALLNSVCNA